MKTVYTFLLLLTMGSFHLMINGQTEMLYVGTYSQRGSEGLYVFQFNRQVEEFKLIQTHPEFSNPNFIAVHPDREFLYIVNTIADENNRNIDMVSAFSIDPNNGKLRFINSVKTHGRGACHISIDNTGKWAFISHYSSGSLSVLPISSKGQIGDTVQTVKFEGNSITRRQKSPHVHSIKVSPDNQFVYVADLGTDKIHIFEHDPVKGKLTKTNPSYAKSEPGSGPRHFVFHPIKNFVYVAEELSNTVCVFERDISTGMLSRVQRLSTLPTDFSERNTVADIHLSQDGKNLYVSNRGHNTLAHFKVETKGKLEFMQHIGVKGDHPRNFMIDPEQRFILVANMNSDNVVVFEVVNREGQLKSTGMELKIPAPVCLQWLIL